jgi:uncharacterized protein YbjQ (UPF0145 family)
MILTTTNNIEGHKIVDYLGIVTGIDVDRSVTKTTFSSDKMILDIEQQILKVKESAFQKLSKNAVKLGANAVVGLLVDIEMKDTLRVIISVTGTAVKVI